MKEHIDAFTALVAVDEVEIYNEFSLQHELGIYLRNVITQQKIQFERNVSFFGFDKQEFIKREIDISLFGSSDSLIAAIELKYPKNGQYPEQMYRFCKDIQFAEELKSAGFSDAYVVIVADDRLFYEGGQQDCIYSYFRAGKPLTGVIKKPTGKKDSEVFIRGKYIVEWQSISGTMKYVFIKAQ